MSVPFSPIAVNPKLDYPSLLSRVKSDNQLSTPVYSLKVWESHYSKLFLLGLIYNCVRQAHSNNQYVFRET